MKTKPREGETPIERPLTPHEGWTGRRYPNYKTQWKTLLTPLCEVVVYLDKQQRGSKSVNPGVPCLYLGPAYDNTIELNMRHCDGKRIRARYVYANEDRMPLRDGPSPGLIVHHSVLDLQSANQSDDGYIRRMGVSPPPRFVESSDDMATSQDLGKDSRLTSVVEDDKEDKKMDQSQDLEPGMIQLTAVEPTTVENDEPQPVMVECSDEPQGGVLQPGAREDSELESGRKNDPQRCHLLRAR